MPNWRAFHLARERKLGEERRSRKRLPKIVFGLTGVKASGKTTVAEILMDSGFKCTNLRDVVQRRLEEMHLRVTRENMELLQEKMIDKHGRAFLAIRTRSFLIEEGGSRWVVEGIAHPTEVREFGKLPYFVLVGVEADLDAVYQRMQLSRRRADRLPMSGVQLRIERELGASSENTTMQIARCLELSDYLIDNKIPFSKNDEIEKTGLYGQVKRMLSRWGEDPSPWEKGQRK